MVLFWPHQEDHIILLHPRTPQPDFASFGFTPFVPPSLFINIVNISSLSYATYEGIQLSSYVLDLSFFSTPPPHVLYTYESMTAMFTDPFTFGTDYSGHSFELGGSLNLQQHGFVTP